MDLNVGMIYKHFKGHDLIEKNIYEILAINVKYTGENDIDLTNLVVYRSLFQDDKYFAREYDDLVCELTDEQKKEFEQTWRVEPLNEDELKEIKTEEFILKKSAYLEEKYKKKTI